ncbi:MAG: phenylacetate--CoA ligase [Candidatus Nezhaarchaeales archaeon]
MEKVRYWDPKVELMSVEEMRKLQLKRLKAVLNYVYERSAFYRRKFDQAGVKPDDLKTLEDLRKFPFTVKDDLREYGYPHGGDFRCVPMDATPYFHCTSGTTGKPTVMYYTEKDKGTWEDLGARSLTAAGVRKGDIMLNCYGYGLFTGGLGFHYAGIRVGAVVIPWSVGRTEAMIQALKDFKVTVLTGTPSYEYYIGEVIGKMGLDPVKDLYLRVALPGAETWTEDMRRRIEESLGLKAHGGGAVNCYGLAEMGGPFVGMECVYEKGVHLWVDSYYVEVINPETGEAVGPEEEGELVFTNMVYEGMPIIRYRTRDITKLIVDPCECGRKAFPRFPRIVGRTDDSFSYKGTKIFPSAVHEAVMKFPEVQEFQIVVDKTVMPYTMVIRVEVPKDKQTPELKERIERELDRTLFVAPPVEIVDVGVLPRFEGKAKRVIFKEPAKPEELKIR